MSRVYDMLRNAVPSVADDVFAQARRNALDRETVPTLDDAVEPQSQAASRGANSNKSRLDTLRWQHRFNQPAAWGDDHMRLVHRLFGNPTVDSPQVVIFSDVDERKVSSGIPAVVGGALAAVRDGSVCVIDANPAIDAVHLLGADLPKAGFTDVTERGTPVSQAFVQVGDSNLWAIAFGSCSSQAGGFYSSASFANCMLELRSMFDFVIISAPLATSIETMRLAQKSDGVVLIIEANSTQKEAALAVKTALESAHVRLLGAILNNRTYPIPRAIYRRL